MSSWYWHCFRFKHFLTIPDKYLSKASLKWAIQINIYVIWRNVWWNVHKLTLFTHGNADSSKSVQLFYFGLTSRHKNIYYEPKATAGFYKTERDLDSSENTVCHVGPNQASAFDFLPNTLLDRVYIWTPPILYSWWGHVFTLCYGFTLGKRSSAVIKCLY